MSADQGRPLTRQQRRQAERDARRGRGPVPGTTGSTGVDGAFHEALRAHADGRTGDAEQRYRRVLAERPDHAGALRFLGLLLDHREELVDALNGLPAGTDTAARAGDAAYQTALAHVSLGHRAEAEQALRSAVADDGAHAPALTLLAELRREAGGLDEAAALARRAVGAGGGGDAHKQLGLCLASQERVVEAITELRRAAALLPNDATTWLSLGNVLLTVGEYGEATTTFERARDLEPGAAALWNNLAVSALGTGRFADAADASRQAIELEPGNARYRYNRAFGLLGQGLIEEGWRLFEEGFAAGGREPVREFPVPRWEGDERPDDVLLIWREQGVGDEIRLASCYEDVARRVGRVIIETDPRLVSLFSRSFPWATVRPQTTGPPEPDFDLEIPAASVPRHVRATVADFPVHEGYLRPDPRQAARFRDRLDALGPGLKVGLSWRSMNLGVGRLGHYTVLDEWEPLGRVPGVQLVSLQYGVPEQVESELAAFTDRTGIAVHRWDDVDYTADFEAVAALIAELDVVAGVGTTPALLAGALGRPVHMLALPDPMALGQEHYPWLPSLRRVAKGWDEPWSGPIARIAASLEEAAG